MKQATPEQIETWIRDVVVYERARLPCDHPKNLPYGGALLSQARRNANQSAAKLRRRGLYDADAIRERVTGGIDIEAFRDKARAERERREVLSSVTSLVADAPIEKLRAVLAMLGEAT